MLNAISDPQIIRTYHSEYLKLINYYMNAKRSSSFVRYYNIDINNSTYDDQLEATYDLYHVSDMKFNIYDFTPSFYLAPIVNAASNVPDSRGQSMDASSSIVVYSIDSPRIHDLLMFYGPVQSGEIFRVTGIRTAVNAIHSDPNVKWFELELEYAPITQVQIKELPILNHYVYDLSDEKYIPYLEYKELERRIAACEKILDDLKLYYDSYYDLYQTGQYAPVEVNEVLIFFKQFFAVKYKRIFEKYFFPYGYFDIVTTSQYYSSVTALPYVLGNYTYQIFNLSSKLIETYEWSVTNKTPSSELDNMFLLSYQLLQEAFNWQTL
jgi:hypothetical protein